MNCQNCGFDSPIGMKYCGMCGNTLAHACSACGFANPPTYRFCGMCGVVLEEPQSNGSLPPALVNHASPNTLTSLAVEAESSRMGSDVVHLEGERRLVTVIVADVTGSTNLLEQVGNEAWVEMMNRVLLALEAEVYRFGGVVNQFRGDGLVAFFGSEVSSEDDPERAILTGLAMLQAIDRFDQDLKSGGGPGIRLRVGINLGEVIVASIGDARQHREDTAMGIAIAVAARLESSAEPGTVLVSESVYQQCENHFHWQDLGEISVRGITRPMAVYRPVSLRSDTDRAVFTELFGSNIPVVGRDDDIHRIIQYVELLRTGQGSVVCLSGAVGIGKQAIITEVHHYYLRQDALLADAQGDDSPASESFLWLFSRSRSYNHNWPYSLWIGLIHHWLQISAGQSKHELRDCLRDASIQLWGEQFANYYPYLVEMLQLPLEEEFLEKVRYLSAESLRIRIYEAVSAWLENLAVIKPVVVSFSELEHVDPSSLQLVKHCMQLAVTRPILFCLLYRLEPGGGMAKFVDEIKALYPETLNEFAVNALTSDDINQLIDYLIGETTLPLETRDLLVRNSEGNPSYIVEILRSLIIKDILIQDSEQGGWCLSKPVTSQDLQGNLNRLVQARIDRLDDQQKHVLQLASVIGILFWGDVLQELVGEEIPVRTCLKQLAKAQLIDRRGRNLDLGTEYAFHTDLIHGVVYESLLTNQREVLHFRVATILEELIQEDGGIEHQALIAYQFRRARETRKELFYVTWAAEKARVVFAEEEAFAHYDRAMELLDILEKAGASNEKQEALHSQRFEVLNGRLSLVYQVGMESEAQKDASELLVIAGKLSSQPTWMIDALLKQPQVVLGDTWDLIQAGLEMVERALSLARQIGDRYRELAALVAQARLLGMKGELAGYSVAQHALELAKELDDPGTQIMLLLGLSNAHGMEQPQQSRSYLDQALALRNRITDKHILLDLLAALGSEYEREGNYVRLLDDYVSERLAISQEIGDRLSEGFVLMYYAQIEGLHLGEYESALKRVKTALQMTNQVSGSLYPMLRIAQIQARLKHFDDADETLLMAKPLSEQSVYQISRAGRWLVKAILLNERGTEADLLDVLKLAENVKQLVTEQRISRQYLIAACCEAAHARLILAQRTGDVAVKTGHWRIALEETTQAVAVFRQYGFVQIIECASEEVLYRHGKVLLANQRLEEAQDYFRQAYEEMMRKYDLIPVNSHYRRSFLENIEVHKEIANTHPYASNRSGAKG